MMVETQLLSKYRSGSLNHTCCQLQDLELSSAEINISTDGGSYVIAACKKLGASRLSCFPHLLNLVVANDTIKK